MPDVSFLFVDGVDVEVSIKGSWFSSSDVNKSLIDSDANEVDPLMSHDEEVESPLKEREEYSNSTPIDSKESSNFLGVEDVKQV